MGCAIGSTVGASSASSQLLEIGRVSDLATSWRDGAWTSGAIPDVLVKLTLEYVTHEWFDDSGQCILANIMRDLEAPADWPSSRINGYRSSGGFNVMDQFMKHPDVNLVATSRMMQVGAPLSLCYYRTSAQPTILHAFCQRPKRFRPHIHAVLFHSSPIPKHEVRAFKEMAVANVEHDRNELEKTDPFNAKFWTLDEDQRMVRHAFESIGIGAGYMKPNGNTIRRAFAQPTRNSPVTYDFLSALT